MFSLKHTLITLTLCWLITLTTQAQERNRVVNDTVRNQTMIVGYCDREFLEGLSPFNLNYSDEYRAYAPDIQDPAAISELMQGITITLVLGTWCSDSREQVPRFFKVLDEIGYPSESIAIIGVDRGKKAGALDISHLGIGWVPTFIFYRSGVEAGRITETPSVSLEADLIRIIKGKKE